jgi:hypothetical protein
LEYAPRGPVYREKSGTADFSDRYDQKCSEYRVAMREKAEHMQRLNAEMSRVGKYIEALQGHHWSPGIGGVRRPRYKSHFVDNRVAKTRYDDLAQLTDARPTIDITTSVDAYQDIAKTLDFLIHHEWVRNNIDLTLVTAADICKAYGTAFWKMGAAKPGITRILPCGPDQVLPINPDFSIQGSSAVLYRTWKDPIKLKRQFPLCAAYIEQEADQAPVFGLSAGDSTYLRPAHIDQYTWNALNPGLQLSLSRGVRSASVQPGPMGTMFNSLECEEYWIDDPTENNSLNSVIVRDPYLNIDAHNWWYEVSPGKPLYPRKRLMTFVGKRVVYDGPSPFWHGLYPFPCLRLNPVFYSFWGLSKYRDLMPINQAINEIVAGILDLIKRVLNPTSVSKEGAIHSAAWKEFFPDIPGMKLKVTANTNPADAVKFMDSPVIPPFVAQLLIEFLGPEYDRIAGNVDVQALMKKAQVPGGDTIDQMRDAMQTGLRLEGRMTEVFLRDAGVQAMSNFLQFYTPETMLALMGEAGITAATFNGNWDSAIPGPDHTRPDFFKNFALGIEPGSLHAGAHDKAKMVAITLAQSGLISRQQLYRTLGFTNGPQILSEIAQENQPHPNADPNDPDPPPFVPPASGRNARQTRSARNGAPV